MGFDEREYARKRAEVRQQSSWFKLVVGDNTFRILPTPPTKTVKTNFFEYAVHREVGPKKATVRCGVDPVTGEGECWLCDVKIPALKKKRLETRATALAPKAQLLVQVAKVDGDDGKMSGPFLFTPSKQVADQLLASIFGSKKRSYIDPAKGYNISISRTGTGRNDTRYGILEPDQEPTKVPQALLDKVKPFESLKEVPLYSQAKQQAAYLGQDVPEDEEEEEDRPKSKTRKPAPVEDDPDGPEEESDDEDADDEDEEVEEDADEEEEPAPKKTSKAPAAKKGKAAPEPEEDEEEVSDDEDVDEEEEDEPEDEEEAPAPKKTKATPPVKGKKKPADEEEEEEPEVEVDEDDPEDEIDLDDLEDEAEEEEEEPAPKKAAKPAAKTAAKPAAKASPKPKARR